MYYPHSKTEVYTQDDIQKAILKFYGNDHWDVQTGEEVMADVFVTRRTRTAKFERFHFWIIVWDDVEDNMMAKIGHAVCDACEWAEINKEDNFSLIYGQDDAVGQIIDYLAPKLKSCGVHFYCVMKDGSIEEDYI